jgi:hypothetical protein
MPACFLHISAIFVPKPPKFLHISSIFVQFYPYLYVKLAKGGGAVAAQGSGATAAPDSEAALHKIVVQGCIRGSAFCV